MVLQVKTSFELSPSTLEETESIIMMITTWFVARQARTTSLFNSHLQDGVNLILLLKKIFRFPFYIQWWFSKEAYLTRFAAMLQNLLLVLVVRFTMAFSLQCRRFLRSREFFFSRESAMLKLLSQSSSVIKSKMAATTIRTWTSFPPPKIHLHWGYLALGA